MRGITTESEKWALPLNFVLFVVERGKADTEPEKDVAPNPIVALHH